MAYIPGSVPVTGFIAPTDDTDTFAAIDPIWGIDGLRSVPDATARDAIPSSRRREGMLVYTQDDNRYWQLLEGPWSGEPGDWIEATFGSQGVQGSQGEAGPQGAIGAQGLLGSQGPQGNSVVGPQGDQGVQGAGSPGPQGSQGETGPQGAFGGPQGVQGAPGVDGPQGAFGGPQGVQGVQGEIGPQGNTGFGNQGNQGVQGDVGVQGVPGFGLQGVQGEAGVQGVQGAIGVQGVQGTRGSQGSVGATGNTGPQGATGAQGSTGSQGNQGFTGIGLQGVQGTQGNVGPQGNQGRRGFQGDDGTTGLQRSVFVLGVGSPIAVGVDKTNWSVVERQAQLLRVSIAAKVPPTGSDIIVDILASNDGGSSFTSLWVTNPGARPSLPVGSFFSQSSGFSIPQLPEGTLLRIDVIQVGSENPGQDVTVNLEYLGVNPIGPQGVAGAQGSQGAAGTPGAQGAAGTPADLNQAVIKTPTTDFRNNIHATSDVIALMVRGDAGRTKNLQQWYYDGIKQSYVSKFGEIVGPMGQPWLASISDTQLEPDDISGVFIPISGNPLGQTIWLPHASEVALGRMITIKHRCGGDVRIAVKPGSGNLIEGEVSQIFMEDYNDSITLYSDGGLHWYIINDNRAALSDGAQGPTGAQGPQGASGGPMGPQGSQGHQGTTGHQGSVGATGGTGAQGAIGPQGVQGARGFQGAAGANGFGVQGSQGVPGASVQGPQGQIGPQGEPGGGGGGDGIVVWGTSGTTRFAGACFYGRVVSGSGQAYQVDIFTRGPNTTKTATVGVICPELDISEELPVGFAMVVIRTDPIDPNSSDPLENQPGYYGIPPMWWSS